MKIFSRALLSAGALLAGLWMWGWGGSAAAQLVQFTPLHSFDGTNGAYPFSGVAQALDGNFYGSAYLGGSNNLGLVYRITTGGKFTPLGHFTGTNGAVPGAYPSGTLTVGPDGDLYGTTLLGGTNNGGSVFKLTTNGNFIPLASFGPLAGTRAIRGLIGDSSATNASGGEPNCQLALDTHGIFYGTTLYGGSNGVGTVFKITTNGTLNSLYSFDGLAAKAGTNASGAKPSAGLTLGNDGAFYGSTAAGGAGGYGEIFRITTNGAFTPLLALSPPGTNGLYRTNVTGGESITTLVKGPDGSFYDAPSYGGPGGAGTVLKVTTNGTFNVFYPFGEVYAAGNFPTNITGAAPDGLLLSGNNLYCSASNGGSGGQGTLVRFDTNGTPTLLFSFDPLDTNGLNSTGGESFGLTQGSDGSFYSATYWGGTYGGGVVYKITLQPSLNLAALPAGRAVLTWPDPTFNLQSAPEVTGPYATIMNAASPYTNSTGASQQFFRLIGN